jgi:hypothetical protein
MIDYAGWMRSLLAIELPRSPILIVAFAAEVVVKFTVKEIDPPAFGKVEPFQRCARYIPVQGIAVCRLQVAHG